MKKIFITTVLYITSLTFSYGASIVMNAPERALSNRQPLVVQVFLDPEQDTISGISGNFSFPGELFTLGEILTKDSVVPLWVKQPTISEEKYLDSRVHITFEGIFPGGYNGVRSPYYKGFKPGVMFYVTLIPKNSGKGALIVDDIEIHSYDSQATLLKTSEAFKLIAVPPLLTSTESDSSIVLQETKSPTLTTDVVRDPLVNRNAWYIIVNEREQRSAINKIYIAETTDRVAEMVKDVAWKQVSSPYVLFYQDRSKYVHIKVVYSNNTYTLRTLSPVENLSSISFDSRILVGIVFALSLLYLYAKHFIYSKKKI